MSSTLTDSLRASCPPRAPRVRRTWAAAHPDVVEAVRALLAEGLTAAQVAAALTAQGVPTPYAGAWTPRRVRLAAGGAP